MRKLKPESTSKVSITSTNVATVLERECIDKNCNSLVKFSDYQKLLIAISFPISIQRSAESYHKNIHMVSVLSVLSVIVLLKYDKRTRNTRKLGRMED